MTVWADLARALSPVEERPRVADGLESARFATRSGAEYVVVHNPRRLTYARLDPREFDLVPLMDGQHSVKELVVEYFRRHGVLAMARVANLVHLLRTQGLLADAPSDSYVQLRRRLRGFTRPGRSVEAVTRGSDVDAFLAAVYRGGARFLFSRVWLWIGVALGVIGPVLVVLEATRGRYALYDVAGSTLLTIVVLVVLALIALGVHELGHGVAVKHAGRRVYEAGVRLYFGLPAAYVDTSDVWMAPPRARLLTAFAGPWTGLMLGGVCAIAAVLLPTGPVGALLFTAAFVFLVDNLFNFNPLLELDGYYMLIDYLDRPLLRPQALAFVRGPLWRRLWQREPLTREERLLAVFGIGSLMYGVVALFLAVRAWEALLLPLVVNAWESGEPLRRLLAGVLVVTLCFAIVVAAIGLGRQLVGPVVAGARRLGGAAAERRYAEALAALRAVPMWSELPAARLLEVARAMQSLDVAPGSSVVRQGDWGDRFFVIARGAFEVSIDGRPVVRLGRGEYFGERALLHRAPRAATVVAIEPSRVFSLDAAAFDALLASDLALRARLESTLAFRAQVADMPLFRDLSPAELDVLLARLAPASVDTGETVMRQGDRGDRFFMIRSGRVEVLRDGKLLARLEAGEAFGEIALLLDVPRTATVVATEPTELLALDATDFRDVLASYLGRSGELERLSHLRLLGHKRLDEVM